jgi:hypothetical protein
MKLRSKHLAPIIVVMIFGGIALSAALDFWKTESEKIPIRYTSGEFAGEYNPADIRGSYSFGDIAASFDVAAVDLAKAFGMEGEPDPEAIKAKDLETVYGELPDGEIGTDSIRYFVALYTGRPYAPQEDTLLPSPAIQLLRDRVAEDVLAEARARSVSLAQVRPEAELPAEHTDDPDDTTVKGKTTFADLKRWGLSVEEIEGAIGTDVGKNGETVRDRVVSAGMQFSAAKEKLQEIIDSK